MKVLERIYGRPIVANPDAPEDEPQGLNPFADPTCEVCHGYGFVRRVVPIHHEDFGKALPCSCAAGAIRQKRIARMEARIPYAYMLDDYPAWGDQRALAVCRDFAQRDEGSLFLWGPVRTGKTALACGVARIRIARGDDVLFITVPDLIDEFKRTFDAERGELTTSQLTDLVRDTTLVVLDDIGSEQVTAWRRELLYRLINHRQTLGKRTIYTSNKTVLDLEDDRYGLGDRIAWRITAHCKPDIVRVAGANLDD